MKWRSCGDLFCQTEKLESSFCGTALAAGQFKMADISVSTRAYSKLLLHAAKYPHRAVNGVLLAEKTKSKDSKSIKFVDAVPLFHLTLGLAPMLEVALTQVRRDK